MSDNNQYFLFEDHIKHEFRIYQSSLPSSNPDNDNEKSPVDKDKYDPNSQRVQKSNEM